MRRAARVLIVDDHPLTLEGLAIAARVAFPGSAIDYAADVGQAEAMAARHGSYGFALLDYLLPDASGFSGLFRLQHALPDTAIVMITARDDPKLAGTARMLGARGFLSKQQPLDMIARQLAAVAAGGTCFGPDAHEDAGHGDIRDRVHSLSAAQRRVLFALTDGKLNKQIAGELELTEATVKAHLSAIFRKLGVLNRTQAILCVRDVLGPERPGPESGAS